MTDQTVSEEIAELGEWFEFQLTTAFQRAESAAKAQGALKAAAAIGEASLVVGTLTSYFIAYFEERAETGNETRAEMKALMLGTTSLAFSVGVVALAGGLGITSFIGLVAFGAVAGLLTDRVQEAFTAIFDMAVNTFELLFDATFDFSNSPSGLLALRTTVQADNFIGSAFEDEAFLDKANDLGHGGDGNDTLRGMNGADTLWGDLGNDSLIGGGDDRADVLRGGEGDDTLDGGFGADTVKGDAGNDRITYRDPLSRVYGGDGRDWLFSTLETVDIATRRLSDFENISLKSAVVAVTTALNAYGNAESNSIHGNRLANILDGREGNDFLYGYELNDTIYGDVGRDRLYGGDGDDILYGGADTDFLAGGAGNDEIYGGLTDSASNYFLGGLGHDTLVGGAGWDHYILSFNDLDLIHDPSNDNRVFFSNFDLDQAQDALILASIFNDDAIPYLSATTGVFRIGNDLARIADWFTPLDETRRSTISVEVGHSVTTGILRIDTGDAGSRVVVKSFDPSSPDPTPTLSVYCGSGADEIVITREVFRTALSRSADGVQTYVMLWDFDPSEDSLGFSSGVPYVSDTDPWPEEGAFYTRNDFGDYTFWTRTAFGYDAYCSILV